MKQPISGKPLAPLADGHTGAPPLPLLDKTRRFYPRGRDALFAALTLLGVAPGARVLVPALICDSALAPLRAAGIEPVWIDVREDFSIDVARLEETVARSRPAAALLVRYFGFGCGLAGAVERLRGLGVPVVEDRCHCWVSDAALLGEAAVYSLRKFIPVGDGGMLVVAGGPDRLPPPPSGEGDGHRRADLRFAVRNWAERALFGWGGSNPYAEGTVIGRLRGGGGGAAALDPAVAPRVPSRRLVRYLRSPAVSEAVVRRRRENFDYLATRLAALGIQLPWARCAEDEVPMGLPLIDAGGRLVERLRADGIGAYRWPGEELPPEVEAGGFPCASRLGRRTVVLPIHQDLGPAQLERIAERCAG
ncbi:DegT/DnrJ/EryC1/StrS family aminotransferase [Endothiovibrio diazotrophicus]